MNAAIAQIAFTAWFALTHWVPIRGLNDLSEEAFPHEKRTNLILHAFQGGSIAAFLCHMKWGMLFGALFWTISLLGHITSWWLPYFFGWPKGFLKNAERDNKKTFHFLPVRKNHPVPDLTHCGIGIFAAWACIASWGAIL